MIVFKAFKNNSLNLGGTQYSIGHTTRTTKPCILRVSGIHACLSAEACQRYYPDHPVIVTCEVNEADVRESFNGVICATALTPRSFYNPSEAPATSTVAQDDDDDDSDEDESFDDSDYEPAPTPTDAGELARQLRRIASRVEDLG